ncbi:MAG: CAP domain-containing protein [Chlorobiaceae bacterium]|nr:CAP domain-containing protein [Chlorobiaceae bacterium]
MRIKQTGKTGLLLLCLLPATAEINAAPLQVTTAEHRALPASSAYQSRNTVATPANLSRMEQEVIAEINLVRKNPSRYAQLYLVPLRSCYDGNVVRFPGGSAIMTNEGVSALDECISDLQRAQPAPPLSARSELALAARDHVRDQGRNGSIGHDGSDGSSTFDRINRYGRWMYSAGENISYGYHDARTIVAALLIDDGMPSRGHRKNLLNSSFKLVGVNIGPHRVYGDMCVMDFASAYTSK